MQKTVNSSNITGVEEHTHAYTPYHCFSPRFYFPPDSPPTRNQFFCTFPRMFRLSHEITLNLRTRAFISILSSILLVNHPVWTPALIIFHLFFKIHILLSKPIRLHLTNLSQKISLSTVFAANGNCNDPKCSPWRGNTKFVGPLLLRRVGQEWSCRRTWICSGAWM